MIPDSSPASIPHADSAPSPQAPGSQSRSGPAHHHESLQGTARPVLRALQCLAEQGARLEHEYHFAWSAGLQHAAGALFFKETLASQRSAPPTAPPMLVAIVGGASSGKSTLFNNLLDGRQVSRVSIRGHATLGPILAIHEQHRDVADEWLTHAHTLLPMLSSRSTELDAETPGAPDRLEVVYHLVDELRDVLLFDTPDFTSEPARREGDLTLAILAWFDRLIVMLDHERWFDRQSIAQLRQRSTQMGQDRMAVFNRTKEGELSDSDRAKLEQQAQRLGAARHCVLPFRRGRGFRRLPTSLTKDITAFLSSAAPDRSGALRRWIGDSCNDVLNANEERRHALGVLRTALDRVAAQTVPGAWECMTALMTPTERRHLDPISRVLGIADSRRWMSRQRTRMTDILGRLPGVSLLVGLRGDEQHQRTDRPTDRLTLGSEHARGTFSQQFYALLAVVQGSDFQAELPASAGGWHGLVLQAVGAENNCQQSLRPGVPDRATRSAADAVAALDKALDVWNERVEHECQGLSPRIAGAAGAVGIVAAGVLIAVQGPLAALTLPAGAAALSAALGKLAVAAGAGAIGGKQVGRLARVIQERLHGSAEFEAVKRATESYRGVLSDHAASCADLLMMQAEQLVLQPQEPLCQALEALRRPIGDEVGAEAPDEDRSPGSPRPGVPDRATQAHAGED
ncbi:MAG: 50S ribosome-binding GTPase [Planctomycetes bacterium]|nr:50S ribosome-binding GTPase [Planctomycetota bacterium]